MKTDGIILDVDGTIWNSTPIVAQSWMRAARDGGVTDITILPETLQALFGRTMKVIAQNLFPMLGDKEQDELMAKCCAYEQQDLHGDACRICYPGVIETVRELSKDIPVFVVSNCQCGYIELMLEKTGLGDCVTDHECYGNTGKNKDENIRLVVERNHLKAPIYVGDTQGDCDAADGAGVPFVFAAYGFGEADHCAARIDSFEELKALVR